MLESDETAAAVEAVAVAETASTVVPAARPETKTEAEPLQQQQPRKRDAAWSQAGFGSFSG